MDKLLELIHLVSEALSKARELNTLELEPETRQRVAELMKDTKENHQKLHEIAELSAAANGKLDRTALDAALDEVLEATRKIGRVLDELLAKARR